MQEPCGGRGVGQAGGSPSAIAGNLSFSAATSDASSAHVSCSSEMSALHRKYMNDPNFKGVCGKFGNAKLFASGIDAIVGPMDNQFVCVMFNEDYTSPKCKV